MRPVAVIKLSRPGRFRRRLSIDSANFTIRSVLRTTYSYSGVVDRVSQKERSYRLVSVFFFHRRFNETIDFEIPGIGAGLFQHFGGNTAVFSRRLRSTFTTFPTKKHCQKSCYTCSPRTYIIRAAELPDFS